MSRLPQIDDTPVEAAPASPERALACAVILQAFRDLVDPKDSTNSLRTSAGMSTLRDSAASFLTSEAGPWAESLARWCEYAGFDASRARARARRALSPGGPGHDEDLKGQRRRGRVARHVAEARP